MIRVQLQYMELVKTFFLIHNTGFFPLNIVNNEDWVIPVK